MSAAIEAEISRLVHREARFLDEWRLDDWLALYAEDSTYWMPIDETADPREAPSIIYDEYKTLAMRVEQLMRQKRLAQTPRSETIHQITSLEVEAEEATARAYYNLNVIELRSGDWRQNGLGSKRIYPGRCRLFFRRGGGGWLIVQKQVILLERRLPVEGLSFLL